ncbi:MAG: hypothetical protein ACRDBY_01020 [Cetobacterium sp.]
MIKVEVIEFNEEGLKQLFECKTIKEAKKYILENNVENCDIEKIAVNTRNRSYKVISRIMCINGKFTKQF